MKTLFRATPFLVLSFALTANADDIAARPIPLLRTHAHNDYEHTRPLYDALDHGFCSLEADVHLVNGQLLVAHDRAHVAPNRTLQSLYLDPLRERVRQNGGHVYRDGPVVTLLVDVKSEAESTYSVLAGLLKNYADLLCSFTENSMTTKPVVVIISGNRARKTMESEPLRYAALDGRLEDLKVNPSKHLVPLISDNWALAFKWRGVGAFSDEEKRHLREIVETSHRQGRKVRFWGTPDQTTVWKELLVAGVDLINTDDLPGLQKFLLADQK